MCIQKSFNNKTIKFDLINGGNKLLCRNNKDDTISNVSYFTRKMPIHQRCK